MTFYQSLTAICSAVLINGSVLAAVYKSVDAEGNVSYTDEPQGNAQPIELPPLSTIPAPKIHKPAPAPATVTDDSANRYEKVSIVTPAQDDTLRDNTGNVAVSVAVEPALNKAAGDRLQFYLDGQTEGEPRNTDRMVIQGLVRGTHTVEVAVVNRSGKELIRSPAISFFLHRQSVNFPNRAKPTPFRGG